MAWLDELLSQSGAVPGGGFQWDEARMAEEARQAAARRLATAGKRPQAGVDPGVMGGEAVPYSMGMLSPMGMNWPQAPQLAAPVQAAPETPPSTNDPLAREPIPYKDDIPLPRARPDNLDGTSPMSLAPTNPTPIDETALPPNATSTMGQASPINQSSPDAPGSGGGILGKIFNPANAPMLLAMGGGFAGAPSFGTGMRRGFSAAAPQAALLRNEQLKLEGQTATMRALKAKGVPDAEIAAAVLNPDIMKGTIAKYFETRPRVPHEIGVDMMGNKIMGSFDPNTNKFYDAANREIGSSGASGSAGIPDAGAGMLAKGVAQYNPQLHGEDYFNQFGPEVQSAIKAYMRGDTQPTGNPRLKGFETKVKEWARKYGDDVGVPVSDALFSERRKYRTELGSNSAATAGGQAKAFVQGIEHAHSLATKLEKLGNYDPLGVPAVASGINWMRQVGSSKLTGLSDEAKTLGQTLAGEVGKLFSGSAGGGVHEREMTRDRFRTIASPDQLAGALAGTIETMEGGLKSLENRRDNILGPNSDVSFVPKETREKIEEIKQVIARLRGEKAPSPAAAPMAPGNYIFDPATGKMVKQ